MAYIKFNSIGEDIVDTDNIIAYYTNDEDENNEYSYSICCVPKLNNNDDISLYYEDIETRNEDYANLQKYLSSYKELIDFSEY